MRKSQTIEAVVLALAMLCAGGVLDADAQWSIGEPGARDVPAGQHRYAFLVFANPLPGREAEFNDWYTTTHIGDLVQVPGFVGAQRFRIVSNVTPRPTAAGYRHGYLIIWDLETADVDASTTRMVDGIRGGKLRRGAAFDYTPGTAGAGMYEVLGPRVTRPDGKGPTVPDRNDPAAARVDRYIVMDFSEPPPGQDALFERALRARASEVLTVPGWLAAQQFRLADKAAVGGRSDKARYLTVWEIQASSAQAAQEALAAATRAGRVTALPASSQTTEFTYWEPITPYVTRDDFER